ncbi:unnamed protein product [Rotaria socialis]|uniref:EGF-like domain-containing protein n=1 Tax=Rotaria socialis TaxID=392032 RepID=A0A820S0N2_9BILA|nr:unnamed protein product [Rotaria socialis]CAF3312685.1 unnamed protein product [Rotaria socialis]CAF3711523.1 unnamed protein product [Rotaria socialis]CAF4103462.1 unnamed protein product [Rotaria socialis]CAF4444277.1 unnamed protein product [Rotaria socialis]
MRVSPAPSFSKQNLLDHDSKSVSPTVSEMMRDLSSVSANDIQFPKVLANDDEVDEQTLMQVEVVNSDLVRKSLRSELASKSTFLTQRWQAALVAGSVLLALACGIGGLAYWIASPRVITQPYLLWGESCYMNSRSCDASRMLWCPAGTCLCLGDFTWNATAQNCSCGQYQRWNGIVCQGYGYFGDPCNSIPCRPTLKCTIVTNQTCTTRQDICSCDNTTYLDTTSGSATIGQCIARLTYNSDCKTNFDCQDWLGLTCTEVSAGTQCQCSSTAYWNGLTCVQNALGGEPCNTSIPCDTTRGLSCGSGICQCDPYNYWDNVTTSWCQKKKTYAVSCQYDFQCNTTVNLSCPANSTGCNCYSTSYAYMCDCQAGSFWDGQRCTGQHSFNGTCPGQYACSSNLVCYLGHCICPGNMAWGNVTANTCGCPSPTVWNSTSSTCV